MVHRGADDRLARAFDQTTNNVLRSAIGGFRVDHLTGHYQAPSGKVNQHIVALAEVTFPLSSIQFVADQGVCGGRIRHPQQSLGQAHEHQPFLGIEAVLTKQCVEGIDGIVPATHIVDQRAGIAADSRDTGVTGVGELQELIQVVSLVDAIIGADDGEKLGSGLCENVALQDVAGCKHHAFPLLDSLY